MDIAARGYIYQHLNHKIIRVEDKEDDPKEGARLILADVDVIDKEVCQFNFEPQKGYEPFGFIRHYKSQSIVRADGNKLKVQTEEDSIREDALFAFDLEDKTIIHWRTKQCWDTNESNKLQLATKAATGKKYYFANEKGEAIPPYPMINEWKLIKAITAPSHSGFISVTYTVGLTNLKSREVRGELSANLDLMLKIAKASFGSRLSVTGSTSTGKEKKHEASLTVNFGGKLEDNPQPITCVWQYYHRIPNIEMGFLSDIIVVTKNYDPPNLDEKVIKPLLEHCRI